MGRGAKSKTLGLREWKVHWTEVVTGLWCLLVISGSERGVPAVARWCLFQSDHHGGDGSLSITNEWGVSSSKLDVYSPCGRGEAEWVVVRRERQEKGGPRPRRAPGGGDEGAPRMAELPKPGLPARRGQPGALGTKHPTHNRPEELG